MGTMDASRPRPLLTLSASYGAGGSIVAPSLAEALGLPLLDRLSWAQVVHDKRGAGSGSECSESATDDEGRTVPGKRFFGRMVPAFSLGTAHMPPVAFGDRDAIRRASEGEIEQVLGEGGILLGRAGAVIFAREPAAYHVRLDGRPEMRVARAAALERIDAPQAVERMGNTDRVRARFTRRLYDANWADPSLYHVVLDTSDLALEFVVELIAQAALAFWAGSGVDQVPRRRPNTAASYPTTP